MTRRSCSRLTASSLLSALLFAPAAASAEGAPPAESPKTNAAPVAQAASARTREDSVVEIQLLARDADGDALTWRLARRPVNGTADLRDEERGRLRYTPNPDFHGEDSLRVAVSDGEATHEAEVRITVLPVNDVPEAAPLALDLREDEVAEGALAASDDDGEPLRYRVVKGPRRGQVSVPDAAAGRFRYTPQPDFHGEDAFTLEVSDGKASARAEVKVQVAAVNDAPVVGDVSLSTAEDKPVGAHLRPSDVDGDALRFRVAAEARDGEVALDERSGAFTYTPRADFFGEDTFLVEVSDGTAAATAKVTVAVTAVNDAPALAALTLRTDEDRAGRGALSASDVDGDALRFRLVGDARNGKVTLDGASGEVSYLPRADWHGEDAFTVEVSDGVRHTRGAVQVLVAPVNDVPVARPLSLRTAEDTRAQGRITASDVDGDALRFRIATAPALGTAEVDERSGVFVYTPALDKHGADTFTVEVSDGHASARAEVDVEVLRVPDPPVVRAEVFRAREDEALTLRVRADDPDGDRLSFRLLSSGRLGEASLVDGGAGDIRYRPRPDAHGDDEVRVEVSDGRHRVAAAVRIHVAPVNDAPRVEPLAVDTDEDSAVTALLRGDDIDGDALTYRVHRRPEEGKVSFAADEPRRFVFEPAPDQAGEATFEVVAFDGTVASAPARVTVNIRGINDPPVVTRGQRFESDEDLPYSGVLAARDPDGDALRFRITRQPARGVVALDDEGEGRFTFTPKEDVFGTDSFSFTVVDGAGASALGLVRLTVNEVDDPPVAIREYTQAPRYGRVTRHLKGFDPEGQALRFRIVRQPAFGRVELRDEETGEYVFSTDGSGSGTVQFFFVTHDGVNDSLPAAVDVTVR